MVSLPIIIIVTFSSLALLWLILTIVRQNNALRQISKNLNSAQEEDIEQIFQSIEQLGEQHSPAYILARSDKKSDDKNNYISIPKSLVYLPWAGNTFQIDLSDNNLSVRNVSGHADQYQLSGRHYRLLKIPRLISESGQQSTVFSPFNWLATNTTLITYLSKVCAKFPEKLLIYLICPGKQTIDYEPTEQVRIGAGVSWVNGVARQYCPDCDDPMSFIMQIPGSLLDYKRYGSSVIYLLGCRHHPDQITHVIQYS